VFLMGAVAEDARLEAARLLGAARKRVGVLRDEEWQHLAHVLERHRMVVPGDAPADQAVVPIRLGAAVGPGRALPPLEPGPPAGTEYLPPGSL